MIHHALCCCHLDLCVSTLGFAPASSAKVNNTADTTGDTMTYDVDRAVWVASPNNDQGDITAVRINNGKKAVTSD
ncbi:MAG: hypothetical protein R2709_01355 [Marmoricola sp.]